MPIADLGTASIYYELEGDAGNPVLVLSHSVGANLSMWNEVMPSIAPHFTTLRFDTRGHGASSVPSGPYTMDDLGGDVVALLDALKIPSCFFCGLSMGGMIGIWLGIHAPLRVRKLVLANTGARIGTRERWNERIEVAQGAGVASMTEMMLGRWFTQRFQQAAPTTMERVRRMLASNSNQGYAGCCAAIRDADMTASLQAIATPALIVTGAEDPATPPSDGYLLAEKMQHAHLVELETSHISAIENSAGFSDAVIGFLTEPEA